MYLQQEESTRRHVTQLEEIRRKAMEMSTLRGPSGDDHHSSPILDDCKTTISIPTSEEPVATRKCCTLCNLLVCLLYSSILEEISFSVSFGSSFTNSSAWHSS